MRLCKNCNTVKGFIDFKYCKSVCNLCKVAKVRANQLANPEREKNRSSGYMSANRPRYKAAKRAWSLANPHFAAHRCAKRRAAMLKAMPDWLSAIQLFEIKEIYRNCPEGYEVDHIIPLQGKEVRGLHVPWNLQYLTVSENRSKSNNIPQ